MLYRRSAWFASNAIKVSSAFTPSSLPNLIAWYSADSGVYSDLGTTLANNGDPVEQWNDLSGNGNHALQTTSARRPIFNTASFNGVQGITFSTSRNTVLFAAGVPIGTTTALSGFAVTSDTSSSGGYARLISYKGAGASTDYNDVLSACILLNPSSTVIAGYRAGSELVDATIANTTNYRLGGVYDGSNYTIYINNIAQSPTPASTGTFDTSGDITIGNTNPVTAPYDGVMAEIVITSSAIGSTDRTSLDNYFKTHWGL